MLQNAEPRQRLGALEARLDPGTIRLLEALGNLEEWRCLEVGAGAGSIAAWLARRVGPRGHILATDLDLRHLAALAAANLEVRRHDIAVDDLPEDTFDLVHARVVLEHLPGRQAALDRMVAALKPGGWLLAESTDAIAWAAITIEPAERAALFTKASAAAWQYLPLDRYYGRRLEEDLRARGLMEVECEGRVFAIRGGSPAALIFSAIWIAHKDRIVAEGVLTAQEIDEFIALHDEPTFAWMSPICVAAWGRRPDKSASA
jgi:SAM-dependent methyltransferase